MLVPTRRFSAFKDVRPGELFSFIDMDGIWCKTPFTDMQNNRNIDYFNSNNGGFCTAICVTSEKINYIQCNPDITVVVIDTSKVFGEYE